MSDHPMKPFSDAKKKIREHYADLLSAHVTEKLRPHRLINKLYAAQPINRRNDCE